MQKAKSRHKIIIPILIEPFLKNYNSIYIIKLKILGDLLMELNKWIIYICKFILFMLILVFISLLSYIWTLDYELRILLYSIIVFIISGFLLIAYIRYK